MAGKKRSPTRPVKTAGYLAPRLWAGGWILAGGVCACVLFNLADRHGVLAPERSSNRPSVRPVYGVSSSVNGGERREKREKTGHPAPASRSLDGAVAVVLVSKDASSTRWTAVPAPGQEEPAGLVVITMAEVKRLLESRSAVFVDARSAQRFAMGHIPGSLNVPSSDFDNGFARNESRLPRTGKVVVYCESGSCDQAEEVGKQLLARGYRSILHYKEGWLEWEFSDQVQEKGAEK